MGRMRKTGRDRFADKKQRGSRQKERQMGRKTEEATGRKISEKNMCSIKSIEKDGDEL